MLNQITTSYLASISEASRTQELNALVEHSRNANGATSDYLATRIRVYETTYEMTSDELLKKLENGSQKETADIADWLFFLEALRAHAG